MGGKKGENTKKVAGNAKKAEAEAKKQALKEEQQERDESSKWAQGAKDGSKKASAAEKKAEQAAKKLEAKQMLEAEEASQPAKGKGANKKTAEKKTRGTLDLGQLDADDNNSSAGGPKTQNALNASGIDNALDALSLTASTNDLQIDRHPERRREAAYQAYAAWREEELKQEEPGLRSSQRAQRMRKEFEKRPENPMNQVNAGHYAATKADMAAQKDNIRSATEDRLSQPNRKF